MNYRCAASQTFRSRFIIDSGYPARDAELSARQRQSSAHGVLSFSVPHEAEANTDFETVNFGELLFWIEPELNQRRELARLSILSTADYIGFGELSGTLRRMPSNNARDCHWRADLDPASITAPPIAPLNVHAPDYVSIPDTGFWDGGAAVEVCRAEDSSVLRIDLKIFSQ